MPTFTLTTSGNSDGTGKTIDVSKLAQLFGGAAALAAGAVAGKKILKVIIDVVSGDD